MSSSSQSPSTTTNEPAKGPNALTIAPASPQSLIPLTSPTFERQYRLHIANFGKGSNAALDRNLISSTNFPDLYNFSFSFLSCEVQRFHGSEASCQLLLVPRIDHTGIARAVGYVRPVNSTSASSFQNAVGRPGSALAFIGNNETAILSSCFTADIRFPSGVSPFLMGPVPADALPRFDFRFEGNAGCNVDVYLTINVTFSHAGYGYRT